MAWQSYHRARIEEKQFYKKHFQAQDSISYSHEKSCKATVLIAKGILKLNDSQRKTLEGWIITYIRVGVEDVSRWLAHEAKAGEIDYLALGPLILLWAGGVIAG
jgi:hypothetical protein